jgi:hypothetical protein
MGILTADPRTLTHTQQLQRQYALDDANRTGKTAYQRGDGYLVIADKGLSQDAINRGITTSGDYQIYAQQQIADKQIAAQKDIVQQQNDFNQKQLDAQQAIQDRQQQAVTDQALRQSTYNAGQTKAMADASARINDAFGQFSPEYFQQYTKDYMSQVEDQLGYQRKLADKQMLFGLSRQGLSDSQQLANSTGLLDETQGRTLADEIAKAQGAAGQLKTNVGNAKQGLLGQVAQAQSVGPPIATSSLGDVNAALNTQNQQISGIATNAGDVVSSLKAVPTVSTLGNIFSGAFNTAGNYIGGVQAQQALNAWKGGLSGTNPTGSKSAGFGQA